MRVGSGRRAAPPLPHLALMKYKVAQHAANQRLNYAGAAGVLVTPRRREFFKPFGSLEWNQDPRTCVPQDKKAQPRMAGVHYGRVSRLEERQRLDSALEKIGRAHV